ncbi:MAG TPA: hypothetical protein VGJ00_05315 [Rhabdochlamydiaceae bacterium]
MNPASTFCFGLKGNFDSTGYTLTNSAGVFNVESPNGTITGVKSQNSGGPFTVSKGLTFVPLGSCSCSNPCNL